MTRVHDTLARYKDNPYGGPGRLSYNAVAMAKDIVRLEDERDQLREALETVQKGMLSKQSP